MVRGKKKSGKNFEMQKLVQVSVVGFVGHRILVKTWFLGQKFSMKIKQDLEV